MLLPWVFLEAWMGVVELLQFSGDPAAGGLSLVFLLLRCLQCPQVDWTDTQQL